MVLHIWKLAYSPIIIESFVFVQRTKKERNLSFQPFMATLHLLLLWYGSYSTIWLKIGFECLHVHRFIYSINFQVVPSATIIRKGIHSDIESYSAFYDYAKLNETPLRRCLNKRHVTDVYICGIATDICIGEYTKGTMQPQYIFFPHSTYFLVHHILPMYQIKIVSIKF